MDYIWADSIDKSYTTRCFIRMFNCACVSEFELEYLLLEGHAWDATLGTPPRGLQLVLGTRDRPETMDTIVMANLGYFQLKANPGAWIMRLRPGRSDDIYEIVG